MRSAAPARARAADEGDWLLRPARREEAGLLLDLIARAFAQYEGRLDPPSGANGETAASLTGRLESGGALVCERDGVLLGCIFHELRADHAYVGRLAVPPEHRHHGLGDALLAAAERRAAELGAARVRLGVRLVLADLRAYYVRRGYTEVALRCHAGYERPTFVEMEKRLT